MSITNTPKRIGDQHNTIRSVVPGGFATYGRPEGLLALEVAASAHCGKPA